MTTFPLEWLVETSLSLLILLGVYRYGLENEPMHPFKRVYLLGTILLSFGGPLVSVQVPVSWVPPLVSKRSPDQQIDTRTTRKLTMATARTLVPVADNALARNRPGPMVTTPYWLWLYGLITSLMLLRFGRNLYGLIRQIRTSSTEPFYGATLVRLPTNGLPYTFLHYLFVPADAYDRGEIEDELLDHELTHIRQRHSLDVLLVEVVLCFNWFNPLVFWLKRAMQRNHEFLADAAVNETYRNVPGYQQLLLSKLPTATRPLLLTSTLTFQTTKQRLLMMTKQPSPARTWLVGCLTAPLFALLTLLLAGTAPAQQTPTVPASTMGPDPVPLTEKQLLEGKLTVAEMERRFSDKLVHLGSGERRRGNKDKVLFKDLTAAQKARVSYIPPDARQTPTEAQWTDFKNIKKYGIWVDSKRRRDDLFSKYKRTDIVTYWYSFVHKNARQPEGYAYQLELYTEAGYQQTLQECRDHPLLVLESRAMRERKQQQMRTAK